MKKRIVCFIGAVALMLSVLFVLPTSAADPACVLSTRDGIAGYYYVTSGSLVSGESYRIGDTEFVASGYGLLPDRLTFVYGGVTYSVVSIDDVAYSVTIEEFATTNYPPVGLSFDIYSAGSGSGGSYEDGYNQGFSDGEQVGYDNGFDFGYQTGYGAGVIDGTEQGSQAGYDRGYQDGLQSSEGYDLGFAAGESAGRDVGYQSGYQAGLEEASKVYQRLGQNVFSFATVTAHGFVEAGDEEFTITVTPHLISNGVSFATVYTQILAEIDRLMPGEDTVSSLDITFTWSEAESFDYGLLYFSANADNFDFNISDGTSISTLAALKDPNVDVYYYRRYASGAPGYADSVVQNYMVRSVQLKYASLEDQSLDFLTSLQLYSGGPFFTNGYAAGYSAGLITSSGSAYDQGVADGYKNGYINGKNEGIQITENGDWSHLMAAVVDTPINAINSLFNFQVLGLDMRVAFGSLLALCMFLFVVKKVIL